MEDGEQKKTFCYRGEKKHAQGVLQTKWGGGCLKCLQNNEEKVGENVQGKKKVRIGEGWNEGTESVGEEVGEEVVKK